ncbi:CopG family transcriptional regulator [Swingsia samuiensis]|uniref:CopG family transcriptional regulator n=1 Tax=Swingsia samuiensis TaxID=1293412 RepID=A0A4Y6UK29_9PROT|nr:CopG family transcriptional regulator [Swingsia samuiensis]QDH17424.1 CopG family transcriptional regulator [Swingsia samuiensis]
MGRPKVESEEVRSRVQQPLLGQLDKWAEKHNIPRAEAVRRLIQKGLEASKD